jgi:hypothetical protein
MLKLFSTILNRNMINIIQFKLFSTILNRNIILNVI